MKSIPAVGSLVPFQHENPSVPLNITGDMIVCVCVQASESE